MSEHQMAITAVDTYWIPKTMNLALKQFLENLKPVIVDHYNQAKAIQSSLNP